MLDPRSNSILYQSQTYLVTLVDSLVTRRKQGKALDCDWAKADQILALFEAWTEKDKLDDINQTNYSLNCLIRLAELNQFPVAPTFNMALPPALIAEKGEPGAKGPKGDAGQTGYATDVQTTLGTSGIVDSFSVTDAKAARWEYVVTRTDGVSEQRSGIVRGTWSADGSEIDFFDNSTNDINGPTDSFAFDIQVNTGNIQLIAVITGGTWLVVLSRFFTPANGNGSGPISNVLPNGLIYIGNVLNEAQAQAVSGVININNLGVTVFPAGVITNAAVNSVAGIDVTKLAALSPTKLVVTDSSGFLTTLSGPSLTELANVIGSTSSIQDQLNALNSTKLTDPMTTVGDIIIRNGSNVTARLGIGTNNQVLTVAGGVPTWQNPAGATPTLAIDIGDWDMNALASKVVTVPGIVPSKVRSVTGVVRTDVGSFLGETYYPIVSGFGQPGGGAELQLYVTSWYASGSDTKISLQRAASGSLFESVNFDATSYNRGWLIVTYIP